MDVPKVSVFTADQRKLRGLITEFVAQWKRIVEMRKGTEAGRQEHIDKLKQLRASKPVDQDSTEAQEWIEKIQELEELRAKCDEKLEWVRPLDDTAYQDIKEAIQRSPSCFTPELFLTGDPDLDRDFEQVWKDTVTPRG